MRIAPNRIASVLFTFAAFAPLGTWYVLLFVAMPKDLTVWQGALEQAVYAFSPESPAPWFFVALAMLPLAFVFLAFAAWRAPASAWRFKSSLTIVAITFSAVAMAVMWVAALWAGFATYLLVRNRGA